MQVLQLRCFPVNIGNFLGTTILKNLCKRLLLQRVTQVQLLMLFKYNYAMQLYKHCTGPCFISWLTFASLKYSLVIFSGLKMKALYETNLQVVSRPAASVSYLHSYNHIVIAMTLWKWHTALRPPWHTPDDRRKLEWNQNHSPSRAYGSSNQHTLMPHDYYFIFTNILDSNTTFHKTTAITWNQELISIIFSFKMYIQMLFLT